MKLFKQNLQEQDKVCCVLNCSITGRITKKSNWYGMYLYTIKADEEKSFRIWLGISCRNVKFLDWQLRKI